MTLGLIAGRLRDLLTGFACIAWQQRWLRADVSQGGRALGLKAIIPFELEG